MGRRFPNSYIHMILRAVGPMASANISGKSRLHMLHMLCSNTFIGMVVILVGLISQ